MGSVIKKRASGLEQKKRTQTASRKTRHQRK